MSQLRKAYAMYVMPLRLLEENWETGSLEEFYNLFLESISRVDSGSEQASLRND